MPGGLNFSTSHGRIEKSVLETKGQCPEVNFPPATEGQARRRKMNKPALIITVVSLLLFVCGNEAFAGNSVSIPVSATVPAIPGVNAPLLEVQNERLPQQNQQQQLPLVQEDTKEEKANSDTQDEIVLVKTFYVR